MDDVLLCPVCGKPNPTDLEICQFCGARLKPVDAHPIQVGQGPVRKDTSEFEKIKPTSGDKVRPGEAPTKKNTGELEKALPSWLRSVRENKPSQPGESLLGTPPEQNLPLGPAQKNSSDDLPDWLSGLGKAAADDEEEVPDWLAGLRGDKGDASSAASGSKPGDILNGPDNPFAGSSGIDRLSQASSVSQGIEQGSPTPPVPDFDRSPQETPSQKGVPDWLQALQSKPAKTEETPAVSPGGGESLDWLDTLKSESGTNNTGGEPSATEGEGGVMDWLADLPGIPEVNKPGGPAEEGAVPAENLPDWLDQFKEKSINLEPNRGEAKPPSSNAKSKPDWLPDLGATAGTTGTSSGENIPDWLTNLEAKTGPASNAPARPATSDQTPSSTPPNQIPDWLSQFQTDVNTAAEQEAKQGQFESVPETPDKGKNESDKPLPDWLAGLRTNTAEPSDGTPALIVNSESNAPGEGNEGAFSMETPDWLSKINPEQAAEKTPQADKDVPTPDNLNVSELPSWVQAMRPVESAVAEAKPVSQESTSVTEQSGPLAGLSGVLPVGPGLGQLSKPPAYSVKLQATDGQQRYAAALERLVTSESQPREIKSTRIVSNRLWRWLISIFLILAVGVPLATNMPITLATQLKPPEMISAFTTIGSLSPNSPVLVVFDYDPALSGEVEAAASSLIDHLLFQGPRLTLISTSPTGPALAERFLHDTNVSPLVSGHNYQAGQQYVNLGYLAGGPSGVQYFAMSPAEAAPFTLDGQAAWQLPPLQGIQKLSDFSAILVLTDNADSGRVWIEQTQASIGATPLLMVISAQAEPMLLPYYDSGQVKGLVTGLAGGEAYAQTFIRPDGQTGPVQHYWNSFSAGILVAEILIVLGALWNAFSGWRSRRKKTGTGEKA